MRQTARLMSLATLCVCLCLPVWTTAETLVISLQWDAPAPPSDHDGFIVGYGRASRFSDLQFRYEQTMLIPGLDLTTTVYLPDQTPGDTVYMSVASRDSVTTLTSTWSNEMAIQVPDATAGTPPKAPTNLRVTIVITYE